MSWVGSTRMSDKLRRSEFIWHNFIYFVGTMVFGVLSYAYYPLLGRLLSPASFGEVQTLVTLYLQYTIFLNVLDLVVINILVSYNDTKLAKQIVLELEKFAVCIGVAILLLLGVLSRQLQAFLQFQSAWPFVLVGVACVIAVPFIFRSGFLQAQKKFGLVTGGNIVGAAGRLLLGVALVLFGFGTLGAIWGLVVAQVFALGFVAWHATRSGFQESLKLTRLPDLRLLKPELRYAGLALCGSLTVTLLYSFDILIVKHYFDASTAGLYAGISVTARILFFLTASIGQVLLPSVSRSRTPRENQQTLTRSALLLVGIGGAALLGFMAVPDLIVRVLLGHTYLTYAYLLPRLCMAIFLVSIINLLVIYHMALRRYSVAILSSLGAGITLALMLLRHATLDAVVNDIVVGSTCMLSMLLILTIFDFTRLIRHETTATN